MGGGVFGSPVAARKADYLSAAETDQRHVVGQFEGTYDECEYNPDVEGDVRVRIDCLVHVDLIEARQHLLW